MACVVSGCGGAKSDVPKGAAAENIRKVTLAYVEYSSTHSGVGPADKKSLAKALAERNLVSIEEAETFLVSPRDNQPYVIRWSQRPMGRPVGPNPPKPNIVVFENTGAEGTRYVGDGQISIKELSEERFAEMVPEHQPSQ